MASAELRDVIRKVADEEARAKRQRRPADDAKGSTTTAAAATTRRSQQHQPKRVSASRDLTMGGRFRDRAAERREQERRAATGADAEDPLADEDEDEDDGVDGVDGGAAERTPRSGGRQDGGADSTVQVTGLSALERGLIEMYASSSSRGKPRRGVWMLAAGDAAREPVFVPTPAASWSAPSREPLPRAGGGARVTVTEETIRLFRQAVEGALDDPDVADGGRRGASGGVAAAHDDDDLDVFSGAAPTYADAIAGEAGEQDVGLSALVRRYADDLRSEVPVSDADAETRIGSEAGAAAVAAPPHRSFYELAIPELLDALARIERVMAARGIALGRVGSRSDRTL